MGKKDFVNFVNFKRQKNSSQLHLNQYKSIIANTNQTGVVCSEINNFNTTTNYCASESYVPAQSKCTRTLGDPLMYYSNGLWYLYGLLSVLPPLNSPCSYAPLVYTQLPSNLYWLCDSNFVNCEPF